MKPGFFNLSCFKHTCRHSMYLEAVLKSECASAGQHRTYLASIVVLCVALNVGFRAGLDGHSRAGRAGLGLRAFDCRATRPRARRAFANLTGLGTCADAGRAGGHRGLQHILAHIRLRRALRLQHVLGEIGQWRARRHSGLQHPFTGIRFRAGFLDVFYLFLACGVLKPFAVSFGFSEF